MSNETPLTAESGVSDFWDGRCLDCAHPEHEMTCHEMVPNGDPSNGPAYCPCAVHIERMEQEIVRLRAARQSTVDDRLHKVGCTLYPAAHNGFCPTESTVDVEALDRAMAGLGIHVDLRRKAPREVGS